MPDLNKRKRLKWVTASGWRRQVQVRMKQEAVYNCQAVVIPAKMSRERTVDSPPDKRPRFTARTSNVQPPRTVSYKVSCEVGSF